MQARGIIFRCPKQAGRTMSFGLMFFMLPHPQIDQAAVVYPRGGAMMEFCRRGNDCFGKVKCANESKIVMQEKNEIATVA
jgi:hypothetical protein